jgi:glycosyltransferase involved in cell wall biosynthesis
MKPLVSIVIPTHRPDHFRNALACALGQTYQSIEIVVSDNSESSEIQDLCKGLPQVIYRKNLDRMAASNIAGPLSLVSGKYIKYLFDDDLIFPHCIESMIGWLYKIDEGYRKKIGIITTPRHVIDEDSVCNGELREQSLSAVTLVEGRKCIRRILVTQDNFIGEFSTVMFSADFIDLQNPLEIFNLHGQEYKLGLIDVPIYLKILSSSDLLYIPQALSAFRKHTNAGSNPSFNPYFHYAVSDWYRLIDSCLKAGLIGEEDCEGAFTNYINLSGNFENIFPEQLENFKEMAESRVRQLQQDRRKIQTK